MTMTKGPTDREPTEAVVTRDFARRQFRARLRGFRPYLIAGLVVVLVATAGWLLYFSSVVTVSTVDVSGNANVSSARIRQAAQVPMGRQLIRVDLAAITARVETIPAVQSAEVSRSWPHTITIMITERIPVAVLRRGSIVQALDADGFAFDTPARNRAHLPVVIAAPDVAASALREAAHVVTSLRPDIAARIRSVNVQTVDNITLVMSGGTTVLWGTADNSSDKAAVVAVLLRRKVHEIDVSVPGSPTTR